MPESSLQYLAEKVTDRLPSERPVRALQVGNFLGVSLCYLSWLLSERHAESLFISIDPNVTHRGIEDPQSHAVALLDHFGLLARNLIITGYTLERSEEPETKADHLRTIACENVLPNLCQLAAGTFDLVVIDGNHEHGYLQREIAASERLLADGGFLVLDDVHDWHEVAEVFRETAESEAFTVVGDDRRVGILRLKRR